MAECKDRHCPTHGDLKVRGRTFTGTVVESKAEKTATVEWQRTKFVTKYERYEKRRTRVKAHNPDCTDAKKGDIVKIMECRPISKTKNFVVIEKLGKDISFMEREELLESAKVRTEKAEKPKEEAHESS